MRPRRPRESGMASVPPVCRCRGWCTPGSGDHLRQARDRPTGDCAGRASRPGLRSAAGVAAHKSWSLQPGTSSTADPGSGTSLIGWSLSVVDVAPSCPTRPQDASASARSAARADDTNVCRCRSASLRSAGLAYRFGLASSGPVGNGGTPLARATTGADSAGDRAARATRCRTPHAPQIDKPQRGSSGLGAEQDRSTRSAEPVGPWARGARATVASGNRGHRTIGARSLPAGRSSPSRSATGMPTDRPVLRISLRRVFPRWSAGIWM